MPNVNAKKVLAVIVIFAALASICTGISYAENYTDQETRRETVSTESVVIPPNEYGHIYLQLNSSAENRWLSIKIINGTLRESNVNNELYQAWLNGSYNLTWCEIPNPAHPHDSDVYQESGPIGYSSLSNHYIFWNPNSPTSKQVTITVFIEYTDTVYNIVNLQAGCLLITLGAVGLGGIGLFLVANNRNYLKLSRKKALLLAGCLLMIVLGGFLVTTYSSPVEAKTIIDHGTVNVPANDYYPLAFSINHEGDYITQFDVDRGTIQAFQSSGTSVIWLDTNGTEFDIRDEGYPSFNGTSGTTGMFWTGAGANSPVAHYYLLSNVDSYSKNVTYQITYNWVYNNYIAMMVGIALVIFGSIMFVLTLLKGKLKEFNKALENQE